MLSHGQERGAASRRGNIQERRNEKEFERCSGKLEVTKRPESIEEAGKYQSKAKFQLSLVTPTVAGSFTYSIYRLGSPAEFGTSNPFELEVFVDRADCEPCSTVLPGANFLIGWSGMESDRCFCLWSQQGR